MTAAKVEKDRAKEIAALALELVNAEQKNARELTARRITALLERARKEAAPQPPKPLTTLAFGATSNLYVLNPEASSACVASQLDMRLAQLSAILSSTHGEGFETFRGLSNEAMASTLWACADMASECRELVGILETMRHDEAKPA
jgi:hypothetical protein